MWGFCGKVLVWRGLTCVQSDDPCAVPDTCLLNAGLNHRGAKDTEPVGNANSEDMGEKRGRGSGLFYFGRDIEVQLGDHTSLAAGQERTV